MMNCRSPVVRDNQHLDVDRGPRYTSLNDPRHVPASHSNWDPGHQASRHTGLRIPCRNAIPEADPVSLNGPLDDNEAVCFPQPDHFWWARDLQFRHCRRSR